MAIQSNQSMSFEADLNYTSDQKKVLYGLSGYAKPGEMVAIMGASGSGKTSFLNIIGQRLGLSPGSVLNGEVRVNDRRLGPEDFGKLGSFVQ